MGSFAISLPEKNEAKRNLAGPAAGPEAMQRLTASKRWKNGDGQGGGLKTQAEAKLQTV